MNSKVQVCAITALALLLLFCSSGAADETDLVWSTFLGGIDDDLGFSIAVDSLGKAYVAGETKSADFPTVAGAFDTTYNGGYYDVFVVKLDPAGGALNYATFLGGSSDDYGRSIVLDQTGNAHVTGYTKSADFPTTAGAFDTAHNGNEDLFVAKLNPTGNALSYSTFLGGSDYDWGLSIALDNSGNAHVTGQTKSADFPITTEAFDNTHNGGWDVFVTKLNAMGNALSYSTYLGGSGYDKAFGIALDDSGNAYVTGYTWSADFPSTAGVFDNTRNGAEDVFVAKFNASGTALLYSTYLGGSNYEIGLSLTIDDAGNAYLAGLTESSGFPTTDGAFDTTYNGGYFDVFVAKLNPTASTLEYSTFLGGSSYDQGYGIALDGSGNAYVTGQTKSYDFPITTGAFDSIYSGSSEVFVAKLDPTGSTLDYSTFLGGKDGDEGHGIALDGVGNVYVTGYTHSVGFPTTARTFDNTHNGGYDVFVAKLSLDGTPVLPGTPSVELPRVYALNQNNPNPFNTSTEIRYQIPADSHVAMKVFNILGQEVRTLVDADQKANWYEVVWDGRDNMAGEVASGLYFCQLKAGDFEKMIKMLFLK